MICIFLLFQIKDTNQFPCRQAVKIRAETSRTNDCQMRVDFNQKVNGLPKTLSHPVYTIKFDGQDQDADSKFLGQMHWPIFSKVE